jgi:uncharacterized protein YndB with AHSA1/START domain
MMAEAALANFIDRFTVEYVRTYPHPIDRVWRAITDTAEIGGWFMPGEIEPRAGGHFKYASGDWQGDVLAYEPPRLVRMRNAGDEVGYFQYELSEVPDGTQMRFIQHWSPDGVYGQPGDTRVGAGTPWPGAVSGWHEFWESLGDHLDNVPPGSRLPPTRIGALVSFWASKAHETDLDLTPRQLAGIVLGIRRRERSFELGRIYDDHMLANLPPAKAQGA